VCALLVVLIAIRGRPARPARAPSPQLVPAGREAAD